MKASRLEPIHCLFIGLGLVSAGLIGSLFVPVSKPCKTGDYLSVRVADTVWLVPENEAAGFQSKRGRGGRICLPESGEIASELLVLKEVNPIGLPIAIQASSGGKKFSEEFVAYCSEDTLVDMAGVDRGKPCKAYKALGGTTVSVIFQTADWPKERWPELYGKVESLLSIRRKG